MVIRREGKRRIVLRLVGLCTCWEVERVEMSMFDFSRRIGICPFLRFSSKCIRFRN